MSFLARGTRAVARPLRKSTTYQTRRSASGHGHDDHGASHGHGESAMHVAGGSGSESFGKGFYISIASIPVMYLAYILSATEDNFVKSQYRQYKNRLSKIEAQDVLHASALEQAISDRATLLKEPRGTARELRYPEMFNHGSPWNVVAGEGTADMSKLTAYYAEQKKEMEEARVERMNKKA